MKLTKSKLKEIIREEIGKLKEGTMRADITIPETDKRATLKILKKLGFKDGREYDIGTGRRGATFIIDLDRKYESKVIALLKKYRVRFGT